MNNIELIEDEIVSIEYVGIKDTIDITVEDTHMFFANDIYTHNSGFDSEFVEAQQTGGSIKRIQKSHFFMSIGKTPEQKDSNLANIRIIKARFAKDGQTFRDAVFNNDTLEIRIVDDKYKLLNTQKGIKHNDSEDIDRMENNRMHVILSQHNTEDSSNKHDEAELINKINDDSINDINKSLLDSYNKLKVNENLCVGDVNVVSNDEGQKDINININISDEINKIAKEEYLEIKPDVELSSMNIEDIENNLVDPDIPQGEHKSLKEILEKERKNQNVIKK